MIMFRKESTTRKTDGGCIYTLPQNHALLTQTGVSNKNLSFAKSILKFKALIV